MITWSDGLCFELEWRTSASKEISTVFWPSPEMLSLISIELELNCVVAKV